MIASIEEGERRLVAEVDRAVRYRRPVTVAVLRIPKRAHEIRLRAMDLLAELDGDEYLAILPELGRIEGLAAIAKLEGVERRALAVCPEDGITIEQLREQLRGETVPAAPPPETVSLDPAMANLSALVERVADSMVTILVLGEIGVGKQLIAEALHRRSLRRDQPFVKVNCEQLTETELLGAFAAADRGTLFFYEIGALSIHLQIKLLRLLERGPIAARVVAGSHRDLDADVRAGTFRADLLFRIGGFSMTVPPLRDRPTEILPLAEHFLRVASADRVPPPLSSDAKEALTVYGWPGNVRELKSAVERALVLATDEITTAELPERMFAAQPSPASRDVRGQLAAIERAAIVTALQKENNNQTKAAQRLGLSRRAFIYKLEKYGLKTPPPRGR